MRTTIFTLFVALGLVLSACGAQPAPAGTVPTATAPISNDEAMDEVLANAVETALAGTATVQVEGQAATPATTETLAPPTATPAPTDTPAPVGPQLRTAEDIRALGKVFGWVTGGNAGQWVAGAQVELKNDFKLNTLPDGVVFEYECVQYFVLNGEVQTKVVCQGALVRFDTNSTVPAGAVGALWLPWAVKGSATEEWLEGFLNLPCICPDGDCRDE